MKILKPFLLFMFLISVLGGLTLTCDDIIKIPANIQYRYFLSVAGGKAPITYSGIGLPEGITVNGQSISGICKLPGIFPAIITVRDADKNEVNKNIFVQIVSSTGQDNNSKVQTTKIITKINKTLSNFENVNSSIIPNLTNGSPQKQIIKSQITQPTSFINLQNNISNLKGISSSIGTKFYDGSSINQTNSKSISESNLYFDGKSNLSISTFIGSDSQPPYSIPIIVNAPNASISTYRLSQPINSPSTNNQPLIVPVTTPYITNYSFASSLQSTPTLTYTQSTNAAFQKQANINKAISSLLYIIQGFNVTLIGLQKNIPTTTSLLNQAIKSQRVAQAQVNSILSQNTIITNNISAIQTGIKTLQNQMLSTTNNLNNSQAQSQTIQNKITQSYIKINETQNKIQQTNNSLQDANVKKQRASTAINQSKQVILAATQNITSIQNDINNSPVMIQRFRDQINNQKSIILSLQKQLEAAILALVPIQKQIDYYTMIPTVGPGLIQQNKTILLSQNQNIANARPIYDQCQYDIDKYKNLLDQLTSAMVSLENQLAADKLAYQNLQGSQNNQEGLFNSTLLMIATQTQLLNKMKQQQQTLLTGPYDAALKVVSDTTSKVDQLTESVNSLNRKYQEVQNSLASTQQTLNQAIQQKDAVDREVNKTIQNGAVSSSFNSFVSNGGVSSNINIQTKGNLQR